MDKQNIDIDLTSFPTKITQAFEYQFGKKLLNDKVDFRYWVSDFNNWLQANAPQEKRPQIIEKGIEYAEKSMDYHKKECEEGDYCAEIISWEKRIGYLKSLLPGNRRTTEDDNKNVKSPIKFAGSKIDLIRILNALYELRKIEDLNGQWPTKENFMNIAGQFFNVDLSDYESDLSQAYNNGKTETNIKIFNELIKITQDKCFEKED